VLFNRPKLLYYCSMSAGGIVDYARCQLAALGDLGVAVTLLCPEDWTHTASGDYALRPELPSPPANEGMSRWRRRFAFARSLLAQQAQMAAVVRNDGFQHVLCASYSEYLAPLWAGKLRQMAARGVVFGAVAHDPVRDYVVGPYWWHRWSIAAGYSFLREAFVHAPIRLDTVRPMPRLHTTVLPHGSSSLPAPRVPRMLARDDLDLPEDAKVLLSFGHIRDGKNLDLVLRMMTRFSNIYLIVAGKELSGGQRTAGFYQQLAQELGVAPRCRWLTRFIAEAEIGDVFAAADLVILTYSAKFHSASSVLGAAITYRKLCLASGGEGNLHDSVGSKPIISTHSVRACNDG
jgi:glycosyltransferase involved in cell wall biosynthesis